MKVAICFYGQPRFYKESFIQWKEYINILNADVYIHTWWGTDMIGLLYPCAPHAKLALSDKSLLVNDDTIDNLMKLYQPNRMEFNSYNDLRFNNLSHAQQQFYTQFASKELCKQSGVKYDLVIRTRFDVFINVAIPINNIESNTIYTSSTTPYHDAPNDLLSISDLDTFFKISDTFLNLNMFKKNVIGFKHETYLENQINHCGINKKTFFATYDTFDVVRDNTIHKLNNNIQIL